MLPLSLLKAAKNCPLLIELKNGETYNGHLVKCDSWMNINLQEVVCTSEDGSRFWRLPECYIKGTMIKYLRIPDEVYDKVKEDSVNKIRVPTDNQKNRGSKGGKRGKGGHNRGARNQQRERL